MQLKAGIVGLPNVGKSTLFNAMTQTQAESANYPFCTIDPNVGVVDVADERLQKLAEIYHPERVLPTSFQFVDIAGLVKGASQGEGLGNQFLAHIREVDAIVHVVRCYEDEQIIHVSGDVNPKRDIETIHLELVLADLETVEKRMDRIRRQKKSGDKEVIVEYQILEKVQKALEEGLLARSVDLSVDEKKRIKSLSLLTMKEFLYVANVGEAELASPSESPYVQQVRELAEAENAEVILVNAQMEAEIASLDEEDRELFLQECGIQTTGLDQLVSAVYRLLGLITYFTAGVKEVRAWTVARGTLAPQAGGVIHSDFERGFIRAEVVAYEDLLSAGSEANAKANGKFRLEGKEYVVNDGDIIHFRFAV